MGYRQGSSGSRDPRELSAGIEFRHDSSWYRSLIEGLKSAEGVVFDFDGTLVDTLPLHYEAYRRAFSDCGLRLGEHTFYSEIGGTACEVIPRILDGQRCRISVAELHCRKLAHFASVLEASSPSLLPASSLVPALYGDLPLAVATSGAKDGFERVVVRLGWERYFAVTVTGDDVKYGKPHPEPYLLAADRLGVDPERCLAFEDTEAGLASARDARMMVVDVRAWECGLEGKFTVE